MEQGAGRADPQEASDGGAVGPRGRQRSPRGGIGSDGHMMAQRSDPGACRAVPGEVSDGHMISELRQRQPAAAVVTAAARWQRHSGARRPCPGLPLRGAPVRAPPRRALIQELWLLEATMPDPVDEDSGSQSCWTESAKAGQGGRRDGAGRTGRRYRTEQLLVNRAE